MRLPFAALFETRADRYLLSALPDWTPFGGGPTKAGVTVSEATAEAIPTVFACVRVVSNAVAQLPFKLYRLQDGGKTEAIDHALFDVLNNQANPELTSFELRALLTSHLLLWGNAYAEIERDLAGRVVALWPLMPWAMRVDRDDNRRLRFRYGAGTSQREWTLDPSRPALLRLMIHSQDGVTGRSPVRVLRESMGLTIALQQFGSTFFRNGTALGGVLASDQDLDEEQTKEIRASVEKYHAGIEQAHRFLVIGNGFTYTPTTMPLEDCQFLDSRKFQRAEICGAYGVPPHMIADLERATFSNVENESLRWLRDGLEPYLVNWETSTRRDCIGPRSSSSYYARFVRNAMVRGDLKSRSSALAQLRQNGIISANEWRALEELDPISDADGGNVYLVNSAVQPVAQSNDGDEDDQRRGLTIINQMPELPRQERDDDEDE
jgi:HK97 family phage portal protein